MSSILININIDNELKFKSFKCTFMDIGNIFESAFVKFRGKFAEDCLSFISSNFNGVVKSYQDTQEYDWVESVLVMIQDVKDRSVFIFLEDHRIVSNNNLKDVLEEFDLFELDYLFYTYFNSSMLKCENLLPLSPIVHSNFDSFELTHDNKQILSMISPSFTVFSLASVVSVEYLKMALERFGGKKKIYSKYFSYFWMKFIPYPFYRQLLIKLNKILKKFEFVLQLYPVDSPFNVEMIIDDYPTKEKTYKIGVLHNELFADSDDDNGYYGSSLLKRGLYPFDNTIIEHENDSSVETNITLKKGHKVDYKFNSQRHRVYKAPVLNLEVISGLIEVNYIDETNTLSSGMNKSYFINKGISLVCIDDSTLKLNIYDEIFERNKTIYKKI
jgi:hypothetical protein